MIAVAIGIQNINNNNYYYFSNITYSNKKI